MQDNNVLSSEEVDALIQAVQSANQSINELTSTTYTEPEESINTASCSNALENTRIDFENKLTLLLRKKVTVSYSTPILTNFQEITKSAKENSIYSAFKIQPLNYPFISVFNFEIINLIINLLYGGHQKNEETPENINLGKIGLITAEKVTSIQLESFQASCNDIAKFTFESPQSNKNISKINYLNDPANFYLINYSISFDDKSISFSTYFSQKFISELFPIKIGKAAHVESDFWRSAIKNEVIDSTVTIATTLSDVKINIKTFLSLKEGDEIPISDPTLVFLCLNNFKLFKALAGQSNSKIVAKIVGQI